MFMTYNPANVTGPNIKGIYSKITASLATEHYISVTDAEVANYRQFPNNYQIVDRQFCEIPRQDSNNLLRVMREKGAAREAILSPIVVEGRTYMPDIPFQLNVSIGLNVLSVDQDSTVDLWCKVEDAWVCKAHSLEEMLNIARELVKRRQEISKELYKEEKIDGSATE